MCPFKTMFDTSTCIYTTTAPMTSHLDRASKRLDHVCPVVVQVPELAIMTLVRPPEGVVPHDVVPV